MTTLLLSDTDALSLIAELKAWGAMTADTNFDSGIAKFTLGYSVVFKAIRKGAEGQPWIVRCHPRLLV